MWPLIRLLPREFHFNFVRLAPYAAIFSAILIALSGVSFFTKGLNLGIDFIGGSMIEVQTPGPADIGKLRQTMMRVGGEDAQVQQMGSPNSAMLRFRTAEGVNPVDGAEAIKTELTKAFPGITFKKVEVVGPKVSGELMTGGFMALGVAVLLMLLYIWFRFQLQFGLGAVVGVFHDVLLTMGMLSLTHLEFSMTSIAALLTVIGYSMNEKVITFDRLRENLRKYKTAPLADIINKSENERLSRTLITGSTAILALSGAVFFGGPVLLPLVVTMVFGVVVGTYSSIYVALPIILLWGVKRGDEPAEPLKPMAAR
ncbi:protein translocase subunit SecF [Phenylobacterium sp. NIBR 498073]|uniref:protein translocase subunit SecF n=1 Tax=Phenylobacterium sp. NIBR 498073 TaxID=3015177 RepID=UPI0022B36500|nr:protein translocase subunit SecF [Phenylobacterium sp. NIBR 498073]WGU42129.1 protein translocase subunit SecF [Phenylobacterium sp. NIBR 498073]